jgi:hypothetical protein
MKGMGWGKWKEGRVEDWVEMGKERVTEMRKIWKSS